MAVPVNMFNANTQAVTVMVNNGTSFKIGATGPSIRFKPQVPAVAPGFTSGSPTPGSFGFGANCLAITPSTFSAPAYFAVTIPDTVQMMSLQVYIYWNGDTGTTAAVFLNNGQIIAYSPSGSSTPCSSP